MTSLNNSSLATIISIINKLGWEDMPIHIAINAISIMVSNEQADDELFYSTHADFEHTLIHINLFDGPTIYRKLFPCRFELDILDYSKYLKVVDSLRDEVEHLMMCGLRFKDAAREWDLI